MPDEFHRIRRLPPYVFAEVNQAKGRARAAGDDIIDLGMGNPDSPTPPHIVAKLVEAVADPRTHRYSVSKGIPGLRRALAGYYRRRFDVGLDPDSEVIATLGSKEGLANLAAAITSPGDTILVPNPSYPIHQFGFIIAGAACGIAGMIDASTTSQGSASNVLGANLALLAIAGVALGGTSIFGGIGSVWRTVVGVFMLGMITNGFDLLGVAEYWQDVVRGALIVGAVAVGSMIERR